MHIVHVEKFVGWGNKCEYLYDNPLHILYLLGKLLVILNALRLVSCLQLIPACVPLVREMLH